MSKCVVSGGGSLQPHLDEFYEVLDLTVLNGWGLSEVNSLTNWPRSYFTLLLPLFKTTHATSVFWGPMEGQQTTSERGHKTIMYELVHHKSKLLLHLSTEHSQLQGIQMGGVALRHI